jgi:hypothetical protein
VNEPEQRLPEVAEVLISTVASLINLAGIRLTDAERLDAAQAKEAIDAARQLLPLCPEDAVAPLKDALSQVQMLYVRETQQSDQQAEDDAQARADARAKIWTPPGS